MVDAMDTLAVCERFAIILTPYQLMGDCDEFAAAINATLETVDFSLYDHKVQVFESNIRILGGLISAHILATDKRFGCRVDGYAGGLLDLARDLAVRYLPAFEGSKTGIPYARVRFVECNKQTLD
jgi:mannosidase alpha-like ER degradation enhancer 1